ncbi:MAG: hypothetical protein M5U07_12690 [Xanthobacteraceae bacterium]|nr:hypothetical protein [Xanthobacteraceae bacterium]PWB59389.1 MAG: hypothetical protein C3F17_16885 [Bradyrhizobiaceae bacterium]
MSRRPNPGFRRSLLALVGGAALACALAAAPAVADDEEDTFEERMIKYLLGSMGVDVGNRPDIDYRERSPLVLPPSMDLPPPDSGLGAAANPAWPRDPDLKRARQAAAKSSVFDPLWSEEPPSHRRMSPDELRRGAKAGAGRVTRTSRGSPSWDEEQGRPLSPDQLNYKGDIFNSLLGHKPEQQEFTGEPPRTSLTQPPAGYQTPSPSHPYGIAEKKGPGYKIPNPLDRAVGQEQ